MNVNLSLSNKTKSNGYKEIMLRFAPKVNGTRFNMRAKSGIFINPMFFDESKHDFKKLDSRNFKNYPDLPCNKEQKRKVEELVGAISLAYDNADEATITKDWLKEFVELYLHPELAEKKNKKQTTFELAEVYLNKDTFSENSKRKFKSIMCMVARYEGFVRLVNKEKDFVFDYDTITKEVIEDLQDYIRNESTLAEEYPETFAILFASLPTFLETKRKQIMPRGHNSMVVTMKNIKAFFAWLRKNKYTTNNPFEDIEIGSEKYGTPYYISIAERNKIADAAMPTKHLETQRDIFVFQCLIGCRVGDLMNLTPSHIQDGILAYTPNKTKNEGSQAVSVRIPLTDKAMALVEKYKGADKGGRLFPFISSQKYNDAIKEVFASAEVTRMVEVRNTLSGKAEIRPLNEIASSHMARRTFVGNLYFKVKDANLIGKMSGHVEGSKAFSRYRNIEDSTLKEVVNLLD